jgi:hypothetical protein
MSFMEWMLVIAVVLGALNLFIYVIIWVMIKNYMKSFIKDTFGGLKKKLNGKDFDIEVEKAVKIILNLGSLVDFILMLQQNVRTEIMDEYMEKYKKRCIAMDKKSKREAIQSQKKLMLKLKHGTRYKGADLMTAFMNSPKVQQVKK